MPESQKRVLLKGEARKHYEIKLIRIVRRLSASYERVYPKDLVAEIMAEFGYYRCEQTVRKDLRKLAESGRLIRVGGFNARKGYAAA